MATPIVYTDGDGEYIAASLVGLEISDSTLNDIPGDIAAIPIASISTNASSTNLSLDEDYSSLPTEYTLQISDSTTSVLGDIAPVPIIPLSSNGSTLSTPVDEDIFTQAASFNVVSVSTPLRALNDSELPAGEGGGPTTTQIWKTG